MLKNSLGLQTVQKKTRVPVLLYIEALGVDDLSQYRSVATRFGEVKLESVDGKLYFKVRQQL